MILGSLLAGAILAVASTEKPSTIQLTPEQALAVGKRIWQNECAGTVEGLTSWNRGEEFASLGIGHFIWYPEGKRGPFEESFPALLTFLQQRGVTVPPWLAEAKACPWPTRDAFERDRQSPRMKELRAFLAATVGDQALFAAQRLERALPKMTAGLTARDRAHVETQFRRVASTPHGVYCLMDYVNFKGEGVKPTERYRGEGWGLLQVLQGMRGTEPGQPALNEFSRSALAVLTRRVENSPPERKEARWLPGWRNRCLTYQRP